jgi:inosine-uridine nucleoside N-ribohydrolase
VKRPVILDVDTGVDDAIAILLALRLPQLDVRAITTVSGNVHVDDVIENTRTVVGLLNRYKEIPIGRGSAVSLRRKRFHAPEVHGRDGLGNIRRRYRRYATTIRTERAVPLLLETVRQSAEPVTVIATGPLTNIARAIRRDLRTMRRVCEIVSMGGAIDYRGNTGPLAEFNYYVDPAAVEVVARSGIPLTMVPLNVTETVPVYRSDLVKWCEHDGSLIARFLKEVTEFYMAYHRRTESIHGGYMHDPLAVAIVAIPKLVTGKKEQGMLIETAGTYTGGTTLVRDAIGGERKAPRVTIIYDIDRDRFWKLFRSTLFSK